MPYASPIFIQDKYNGKKISAKDYANIDIMVGASKKNSFVAGNLQIRNIEKDNIRRFTIHYDHKLIKTIEYNTKTKEFEEIYE